MSVVEVVSRQFCEVVYLRNSCARLAPQVTKLEISNEDQEKVYGKCATDLESVMEICWWRVQILSVQSLGENLGCGVRYPGCRIRMANLRRKSGNIKTSYGIYICLKLSGMILHSFVRGFFYCGLQSMLWQKRCIYHFVLTTTPCIQDHSGHNFVLGKHFICLL